MVSKRHPHKVRGFELGHLMPDRVAQVHRLEKIHVGQLSGRDAVDEHAVELGEDREMREQLVRVPAAFVPGLGLDEGRESGQAIGCILQAVCKQVALAVEVGVHKRLDVVERERRALDLHPPSD